MTSMEDFIPIPIDQGEYVEVRDVGLSDLPEARTELPALEFRVEGREEFAFGGQKGVSFDRAKTSVVGIGRSGENSCRVRFLPNDGDELRDDCFPTSVERLGVRPRTGNNGWTEEFAGIGVPYMKSILDLSLFL